jgi:hypothetical protein
MALGLFITITATPAVAKNSNPGVLPPGSTPKGLTYGEWSAQWWQWALGILAEMNPLLDGTGEFCDVDQSGSVWFLAGIFGDTGGTNVRECTIPPGKMLFFPVINSVWITTCLNEPRTQDEIRPLVAPFIDAATGLAVEVDGVPLQNLEQYRVESPLFCTPLDLYGIETAEDLEAADICPAGESVPVCYTPNPDELFGTYDGFGPAMADGYWIMLAPLSVGEHTIQFDARSGDFVLNITYYLTIGRE